MTEPHRLGREPRWWTRDVCNFNLVRQDTLDKGYVRRRRNLQDELWDGYASGGRLRYNDRADCESKSLELWAERDTHSRGHWRGRSHSDGNCQFQERSVLTRKRTLSSGVAVLNTTKLPVGSDSLTAMYNGDSQNAKSTSSAVLQTVNIAQITLALTSSPNPSKLNQSVKFTATLTSNGSLPTGTITFSYNGTTLGTGTISGGKANHSVTTLPAGADQVTATFAGTANYSSASGSVTQNVN